MNDIQSVTLEFGGHPELDFRVENIGKHQFKLTRLADQKEMPFDTLKVINLLSSFSDLRFEALLNTVMTQHRMDSIKNSPYLHKLTLINKEGETTEMKTFTKRVQLRLGIPEEEHDFDPDRLYGLVNDGRDLVLIQHYIFDKVLKDVTYYEAGNPIQYQIEHYQVLE